MISSNYLNRPAGPCRVGSEKNPLGSRKKKSPGPPNRQTQTLSPTGVPRGGTPAYLVFFDGHEEPTRAENELLFWGRAEALAELERRRADRWNSGDLEIDDCSAGDYVCVRVLVPNGRPLE